MSAAKPRPVIALIAAYVLALQALLLPLSVAAAPFANGFCAAAQTNAPGHTTGCPCAAGCGVHCCGVTLIAPPAAGVAIIATSFQTAAAAPIVFPAGRPVGRGPQIPRAPPVA